MGGRPEAFAEPRPQERVQRHTVEHIVDVPYVQILDAPLPQIVDNVMDAWRRLDRPQVIALLKISCSSCPDGGTIGESADDPFFEA